MKKKTHSLSGRLILIFVVTISLSMLIVGTISYFLNRNASIALNSERALGIARTIAASIDEDGYKEVLETGEKNAYWHTLSDYLDDVITDNHLVYLYVLYDYDDEDVYYFAEGMVEGDTVDELDLHDTETIDNYDEQLANVFAGEDIMSTEIYSADEWGYMVSGMAPIVDDEGHVIGVVGADVAVNEVLASAQQFGLLILLLVIALSVVLGLCVAIYLRRALGKPIAELTGVAKKIALGDTDVEIHTHAKTEIGELADSFRDMVSTIQHQVETLRAIAEGDLSAPVVFRSERDTISLALNDTINRLNGMMVQINALTGKVAQESGQISVSAQSLASGVASQAAALEELSASMTQITIQTKQNADLAEASARLANTMHDDATTSYAQMEQLIEAVASINKASNAIVYVLKVIEDIAFQTNILSLNASVEAAHAGVYGEGFAVVSREIQTLSKRTSEAAKETAGLITDTIDKTKVGVQLAEQALDAMRKVVENVQESDRVAGDIALSSKEQMIAIEQINLGINQVATVVHSNQKVAEESASVSRGMNNQATDLTTLMSRFKVRKQ